MVKKNNWRAEMDALRRQSGELLTAERIVQFAENPKTALHSKFVWDNEKAGHAHRLWQARELMRVYFVRISDKGKPVRMNVSLRRDRKTPKGGYRLISDVLSNTVLRRQLLDEALDDAQRWMERYRDIKELASIRSEIRVAIKKYSAQVKSA